MFSTYSLFRVPSKNRCYFHRVSTSALLCADSFPSMWTRISVQPWSSDSKELTKLAFASIKAQHLYRVFSRAIWTLHNLKSLEGKTHEGCYPFYIKDEDSYILSKAAIKAIEIMFNRLNCFKQIYLCEADSCLQWSLLRWTVNAEKRTLNVISSLSHIKVFQLKGDRWNSYRFSLFS